MTSGNEQSKITRNMNQEDLGKLLVRKDIILISAAEANVVYHNHRRGYCKKGKRWYN